jgi:hypothetical protein
MLLRLGVMSPHPSKRPFHLGEYTNRIGDQIRVAIADRMRWVIGILSERDVVRTFAEFGTDAPTKRLTQIMTREVATCGEADTRSPSWSG